MRGSAHNSLISRMFQTFRLRTLRQHFIVLQIGVCCPFPEYVNGVSKCGCTILRYDMMGEFNKPKQWIRVADGAGIPRMCSFMNNITLRLQPRRLRFKTETGHSPEYMECSDDLHFSFANKHNNPILPTLCAHQNAYTIYDWHMRRRRRLPQK